MWFCTTDQRKKKLASADPRPVHLSIIAMAADPDVFFYCF